MFWNKRKEVLLPKVEYIESIETVQIDELSVEVVFKNRPEIIKDTFVAPVSDDRIYNGKLYKGEASPSQEQLVRLINFQNHYLSLDNITIFQLDILTVRVVKSKKVTRTIKRLTPKCCSMGLAY